MNPSGHFGAFKGLLFYSRIIFSPKKKKKKNQKSATPSWFQRHASSQQHRLGGPVTHTTRCHPLSPLSWRNSHMSCLQVSTRYLQTSPQHPWTQHYAGWVRFRPAPQGKHFPSCSLVSYVQRTTEDTGLRASTLRSLGRHWRFQRRWNALKFHLKGLKSVTLLPLPS